MHHAAAAASRRRGDIARATRHARHEPVSFSRRRMPLPHDAEPGFRRPACGHYQYDASRSTPSGAISTGRPIAVGFFQARNAFHFQQRLDRRSLQPFQECRTVQFRRIDVGSVVPRRHAISLSPLSRISVAKSSARSGTTRIISGSSAAHYRSIISPILLFS